MTDDYTLMDKLVQNYQLREERNMGYTTKNEATTVIVYCYQRGWEDLAKKSIEIFKMSPLEDSLKQVSKTNKINFSLDERLK